MAYYPALIRKEAASDFGVEFPDFPGCVAAGGTLDEAVAEARNALEFHVEGMVAERQAIPAPTPLEEAMESADARGAAAILVPLRHSKGRAQRVNVTFDEFLLEEIDAEAARRGMTRSAFLADAARALIADEPAGIRRLGRGSTRGR